MFIDWMENNVRYKRRNVYVISLFFLIVGIIGINKIKISASMIEDMPKKSDFFKDIQYYDKEFSGVVPIEILINTKRKNGIRSLSTLKKINQLHRKIINYSVVVGSSVVLVLFV